MALEDVKLRDKDELIVSAQAVDYMYILRSEGLDDGIPLTDYKVKVSRVRGTALPYENDGAVPDPVEGSKYFNSTTKEFRGFDGTDWYNTLNRTAKITLSAADIKAIGSTPIAARVAAGAGTVILPKHVFARLNWNSVAFDNNPLTVGFIGGGGAVFSINGVLNGTSNNIQTAAFASIVNNNLLENVDLSIEGTDSVASGDSTIDIYINYDIYIL